MDSIEQRLTAAGSPFQLADLAQDAMVCRIFSRGPAVLHDIFNKAQALGSRPFIVSADARITYRQALMDSEAFAHGLEASFGLMTGVRVGIAMDTRPEWPIAFIGLVMLGAVPVALNNGVCGKEISAALQAAECSLVVADAGCGAVLLDQGEPRPLVIAGTAEQLSGCPGWTRFRDVIARGNPLLRAAMRQARPEDAALIAFTSGTTGTSKGALFTHRSIVTGMMNMLLGAALLSSRNKGSGIRAAPQAASTAIPSTLLISPFWHIGGYAQLLLMPFIGGKLVLPHAQDAQAALSLIEREQVRSLAGASPHLIREIIRQGLGKRDISSLASFNIHGSALHWNLVDEIITALPHATIWTGYGMTETNGSVCVAGAAELMQRPSTCGRPLPSVDLKIMAGDGTEAQPDRIGEIWVRGAMLMREYCGSAPSAALQDGWLRTGDLGRLDSAGFLHVIDRASDVIVTREADVACSEVERVLIAHPGVEEVAVCPTGPPGKPRLTIAIVPRAGSDIGLPQLGEYMNTKLPRLRALETDMVLCEALPRTGSGKVNRYELKRRGVSNA